MKDLIFNWMRTAGPKDWPQDFPLENGCYLNTCCVCNAEFSGYKRRVVCRECAGPLAVLRCHDCKEITYVKLDTDPLERVYCSVCEESHMRLFWIDLTPGDNEVESNLHPSS